ncbi:MAG TPA: hypothetical protein VK208_05135 [Pyrinomonadaceae bacterium]|jgi:hypothetical protein|nr:hypothetical protein [Pyrinomonadaceae bacterium]
MARSRHNGNGDHRHVTETPDVSHIKNVDVTHEASDVSVSGVLKFVLALSVLGAVVFVLMWGMFRFLSAEETEKEPQAGPMAMRPEERLPPDPRLQAAKGFGVKLQNGEWVNLENKEPDAEYKALRGQWDRRLKCKSNEESQALDSNCTPIDAAIDKLIAGGSLRAREGNNQSSGVSLPTAWSSGRVTEKGK